MGFDLKGALEHKEFVEDLNKALGACMSTIATVDGKMKPVKQLIEYSSIEENPNTFEIKIKADTDEFLGGLVLKIKKDIISADKCKEAIVIGVKKLVMKKIDQSLGKEMLDTTLKGKVTYKPMFLDKKVCYRVTREVMPKNIVKLLKADDFEEKKVAQVLKIFNVSVPNLNEYIDFIQVIKGQDKAARLMKIKNELKSSIKENQKLIKNNLLGNITPMDIEFWKKYCDLTTSITTGTTEDQLNRIVGSILLKNNQYPGGKVIEQIANILKTYPTLLVKRADYTNIQSKVFLGKMMRKKTQTFFIMKSTDKTLYKNLLLNSLTDVDKPKLQKQVDTLINIVDRKLDGYTKYLAKKFEGKNIKPIVKEINFLTNELKIKYVKDDKSVKEQIIKLNIAS